MGNYYYNHNSNFKIDKWFSDILKFTKIDNPSALDEEITRDVIYFVHATEHSWWVNKARACGYNVEFVFMSTDPKFARGTDWPKNIHICGYPADRLGEFDRPKKFFDSLPQKRLWELLIPELFPEELVAVYLFMIACKMEVPLQSSTLNQKMWSKAGEQYYERGGTSSCILENDWKEPATENLDICLSDIRKLLEKINAPC